MPSIEQHVPRIQERVSIQLARCRLRAPLLNRIPIVERRRLSFETQPMLPGKITKGSDRWQSDDASVVPYQAVLIRRIPNDVAIDAIEPEQARIVLLRRCHERSLAGFDHGRCGARGLRERRMASRVAARSAVRGEHVGEGWLLSRDPLWGVGGRASTARVRCGVPASHPGADGAPALRAGT